jgi:hypothetical protein
LFVLQAAGAWGISPAEIAGRRRGCRASGPGIDVDFGRAGPVGGETAEALDVSLNPFFTFTFLNLSLVFYPGRDRLFL